MDLPVRCPDCMAALRVKAEQLGRRGCCAECGLVFLLVSPVGRRLENDEPESPQPIEEPPPQPVLRAVGRPLPAPEPTAEPRPEPENPFAGIDEKKPRRATPKKREDDDEGRERPRRRESRPRKKAPAEGSSRAPLFGLAGVCALVFAAGGFFIVRQLTAGRERDDGPEVVAAPPQKPASPTPAPKPPAREPKPGAAEPVPAVPAPPPLAPKKAAGPVALRLDGPVSALYTAGEGRYVLFHLSTLRQLVVYDAAAGKVAATIPDVDAATAIAGGRTGVFVARRSDGRITRYDFATGKEQAVAPGGERINCIGVASGADGPLVAVTSPAAKRPTARMYDPDTLAPIGPAIDDPTRPAAKSFPLPLSLTASHVGVSADGRAVALLDRLYTRTAEGYRAAPINFSSGLLPTGDGKLAVGNSLWTEEGRAVRVADRKLVWSIPAAGGSFFVVGDYPKPRELRLTLYADRDLQPLGELPPEEVSRWLARDTAIGLVSLHRHLAFLPELGLVVFCPTGAREAQLTKIDLPAMLAGAGRDVVFTTAAPAAVTKGRPYAYSAAAVARGGGRVVFALEAGPEGMAVTPDGKLTWEPGPAFADAYADVRLVARAGNLKAVQQFRVFMPLKGGDVVAVNPPPKDPIVPVGPRPPVRPPVNPPANVPADPPANPPKRPVNPAPAPALPAAGVAEVKLPGAAAAVAVGGAGRYVCLHVPDAKQVAVYDAAERKVVKYLPIAGNKVLLAAGAEKLFLVFPDEGVVQRWDLKTFEKEATATLDVKKGVRAAAVGSAATGPLWLVTWNERVLDAGVNLIDTKTLRPMEVKPPPPKGRFHGVGQGARASADGRSLGTWRFDTSPSGLSVITVGDGALKASYQHDSVGHVTPGPDGRVIHTSLGRFTPDGKVVGNLDERRSRLMKVTGYSFPAAQGTSLYLNATFDRDGPAERNGAKLSVHWASDGSKLADLPAGVATGTFTPWDREAIGNDQRFMLLPAWKSLVVLPETNDRLVAYPFDLDAALEKSGKDYLLVDAPPAPAAVRGQAFAQQLTIKSKKGGVKVKLDSGPEGLTVSADGKVSWAVPGDFADDETSVIVTVSDASGQEVLQALRLEVRGEKGAAVAVAPKEPAAEPKKDEPPAPRKDPPPAPRNEVVTVKLPGAAQAAAVGAGGKLLILHLPQQKQLAILDVAQGKVVKYLPTAEATVYIAAGLEHLFVANPTAGVIQRYSLKTFEKEATVQQPVEGTVAGLCMGSASKGPLLICPKGDQWGARPVLVDPIKMKAIEGGDKIPAAAAPFIRASADGRLFGWRNGTGSEGHDMTLLEIVDGKPKPRTFSSGTSLLLPGPDARHVYCGEGVFNAQFKKLYPTEGNNRFDRPFLPAASGGLFMQLEAGDGGRFPGDPMAVARPGRVNFFLPGQYRPFASIDKVEGLTGESYGYGAVRDPLMHDARVHLCPDAGRLVAIPATNDKVVLHPFNLDDLLAKSDTDYLLVTSEPPADAGRGTLFAYAPAVRSKKGGAKVKLESGPDGMTMTNGRLLWRVPADFDGKEADVILTISDATGQEVFQTFKLAVRDRKPGEPEAPGPKPGPKGTNPRATRRSRPRSPPTCPSSPQR